MSKDPNLERSSSASTGKPESLGARLRPSRTNPSDRKDLSRMLSAQHLDDVSVCHGGNHCEDANNKEIAEEKDYGDAQNREQEQSVKVRLDTPDTRDLEANHTEKHQSVKSVEDPNLVTWDGLNDPANPKNWPWAQKWAATVVVSLFTFISPVSSTMVAPDLNAIAKEFGITNKVESQIVLSIFVLAYAIGPLFWGPVSETYGRVPVLQVSNVFYLIFNIACGASQSKGQMIAFRFFSGLGGSAPLAIGGGVLGDCWRAEERGRAISAYSLAPLLGPAVGPIAGGFIAEKTSWRWVFWTTSIAAGLIQGLGVILLKETYSPILLHQKATKLRKETGNESLHTEFEHSERSFLNVLKRSLIRPFILLGTQPIVQVLAIYSAYLYGIMYLVLSTFPALWESKYGETVGVGGLNYISLGIGFFLGAQICAPINDRIYRHLKKKNNDVGRPEFRIPIMVPGSLLVPVGLFIYAWTAEMHTHWIGPNIGAAIFTAGVIIGFQGIQTYLVDSYTLFAASAIAAATVLRSLAGFGFPLFAPTMYDALDYGWGSSLLAFIAVGLGVPAPFLIWVFGQRLREMSTFAAGGD